MCIKYYYYYYYYYYDHYYSLSSFCRMFAMYTRNHVSRVYCFAAFLYAQFMLHVMLFLYAQFMLHVMLFLYAQFMLHVMLFPMLSVLYIYISNSPSMCALPSVAVFCSSLQFVLSRYVP
jgi:hypothetical protein